MLACRSRSPCRISGHRTAAIFTRYDITSDADKIEALERTQAHVSALAALPAKVASIGKGSE